MQHYQNSSHTTSKNYFGKKVLRFLLFLFLAIFLMLIGTWFGLHLYLQSNETKIFKNLDFLNDGGIAFDQASISVFKDFPQATISFNNVIIQDSLYDQHQVPVLQLKTLSAAVSLQKLLKNNSIEIQSLQLEDGAFNMFRDSLGYRNLKALLRQDPTANRNNNSFKIEADGLELDLNNIKFHVRKASNGMSIQGNIKTLSTQINLKKDSILAPVQLDADVIEMVLSAIEGTYLANSKIKGSGLLKLHKGILEFEDFDLDINEQTFLVNGAVYTKEHDRLNLVLENQATSLSQVFPLLPHSIKKELKPFQIAHPFYSKTTIHTFPKTGIKTLANIDFVLEDNDVIAENYHYKKVNLEGHFVNRIYEDGKALSDLRSAVSITLNKVSTFYQSFKLQSDQALFTSDRERGIWIYTNMQVKGKASNISQWLENDQFFFEKGKFNLAIDLAAPLKDYTAMAISSKMSLTMRQFSVFYQPANVAFPFKILTLEKEAGDANFTISGSTLGKQYNYVADGGLENFPALLLELVNERSKSEVNFHAQKLGWTDFVDLFGENGYLSNTAPKSDHQKKESMKETLRGLQYSFQPSLSVAIDTLDYYDKVELNKFSTGIHFEDKNTLILEKTSFNYQDGEVSLNARLDISQAKRTPFEFELHAQKIDLQSLLPSLNYFNVKLLSKLDQQPENVSIDIKHQGILDDEKGLLPNTSTGEISFKIDEGKTLAGKITYQSSVKFDTKKKLNKPIVTTKINLEGLPHLFNNFFKTEQFFFEKGRFALQIEYEGDVEDLDEMLEKGKAIFMMHDSQIFYEPGDVTFPITQIVLTLDQDYATFDLKLQSDSLHQKINFTGDIDNLSELILGNTGKQLSTNAQIHAPKLSWQEIQGYFVSPHTDSLSTDTTKTMKSTVIGIFQTFRPNIELGIDTFIYTNKLSFLDLQAGLYILDSNTLVLDRTGFNFQGGQVQLNGQLELIRHTNTPFKANFKVDDLDTASLLEGLNYLSLPSLQNMSTLSGRVTLNLDLEGIINKNGTALLPEANKGKLDFNLRDIEIAGYEPLDKIADKIMMKKRFSRLRFAPITSTFRIEGTEIYIPMTEIQSNTINLFAEGQLSYRDATNIWVSIPIHNFLFSDADTLTAKQGYQARNMKIHVEVTSDEDGKNQFDIHLSRKKFYENRGGKEQYKIDKRAYRELRRAMRREKKDKKG